jgi:ABC-type phosphate/phosphonate transport system substrate-binding protein
MNRQRVANDDSYRFVRQVCFFLLTIPRRTLPVKAKTIAMGLGTVVFGMSMTCLTTPAPGQKQKAPPLKIGVVNTLFRDTAPAKVQTLIPELQNLLREQTGLGGEVIIAGDSQDLGKRLDDNVFRLGVFHGFEFAWARQKHPNLKPLVIAVNRQRTLKAFVAVLNENKAASLDDLKGKAISIPRGSREHCLLFLERELGKLKTDRKDFFGKITQHANAEEALDDILRDKVQAALVDNVGLEIYDQVKPGCYARLKMVAQSEAFPPDVLAYRQGAVEDATLAKVKTGMISAQTNPRSKEQMALWKLTGFELVPANYDTMLDGVLKLYPAPEEK